MKTKEELLHEIEALLSYKPEEKMTINPNYLEYLGSEDLESIKKSLLDKMGKLKQEDIEWLERFKKY
ncbi:MAG: Unknown protein [uncultured Sulfurovum sp.]|uniref:Uncharacterized protein n=1 Tax=uncultured Sulfurovum sp. TaxID=269237 RepID=A0A6S6SU20_9BACT|nr:MAG: Unknown protein [uncultured Sulfurovum sp.]